jgi:hypothetical protein
MPSRLARMRLPSLRCEFLALAALASAACTQSLFDSNGKGDAGNPGGDSGTPGADAADQPDAAPVAVCPEPCVGDAFAEFDRTQGGTTGRWSYLLDVGAANGAAYDELGFSSWNGLDGWSAGDGGPAIVSCQDRSEAACAGVSDFLLLVPNPADGQRPALSFQLPETSTYRVSGAVRIADGEATDVPVQLTISRAGRHDALSARALRTSPDEVALDALFPGLEGEEVTISVGTEVEAPPIAVRFFVTRVDEGPDVFPGSCQVAARFDGDKALVEECQGAEILNLNDGVEKGTEVTVPGAAPNSRLGQARVFAADQFLVIGNSPLDYDGDFTVQFWAKIQEPLASFNVSLYADWDFSLDRGFAYFMDDGSDLVQVCRPDPMPPAGENTTICLDGSRPTDGDWHFWRLVRSTADDRLRLCIDGVQNVQSPLPGNLALSSDLPPYIGRHVDYEPAYFVGSIDEIRVFSEALPCPSN